ncbi:MAG: PatB family C-S lyase [Pseudomonadota bacterium]
MVVFDFDNTPERKDTCAFKWERYKGRDIIPAWVADTEFQCAPAITSALVERTKHGIFGYTHPNEYTPAAEAIVRWCKKQYGWDIEAEWVLWTPGVVPAFNMAIQAYTDEGDAVIVQTPNYPPLLAAPSINYRKRYFVNTIRYGSAWSIDFDALEAQAAKKESKLFILCNPMNPNGGVLSKDALTRIIQICNKHNVTICSDEIHCDLILDGMRHTPISKLSANAVTLMAASKTFNVAGLGTSFAVVPDKSMRTRLAKAGAGITPWVNIMGLIATEVAFTQCDDWHQDELSYLRKNRDFLVEHINGIPGLSCVSPQATYLLWIDAAELDVADTQVWAENKGVGPSPGRDFGNPNCFRINYGCSFDMLKNIVKRLEA